MVRFGRDVAVSVVAALITAGVVWTGGVMLDRPRILISTNAVVLSFAAGFGMTVLSFAGGIFIDEDRFTWVSVVGLVFFAHCFAAVFYLWVTGTDAPPYWG